MATGRDIAVTMAIAARMKGEREVTQGFQRTTKQIDGMDAALDRVAKRSQALGKSIKAGAGDEHIKKLRKELTDAERDVAALERAHKQLHKTQEESRKSEQKAAAEAKRAQKDKLKHEQDMERALRRQQQLRRAALALAARRPGTFLGAAGIGGATGGFEGAGRAIEAASGRGGGGLGRAFQGAQHLRGLRGATGAGGAGAGGAGGAEAAAAGGLSRGAMLGGAALAVTVGSLVVAMKGLQKSWEIGAERGRANRDFQQQVAGFMGLGMALPANLQRDFVNIGQSSASFLPRIPRGTGAFEPVLNPRSPDPNTGLVRLRPGEMAQINEGAPPSVVRARQGAFGAMHEGAFAANANAMRMAFENQMARAGEMAGMDVSTAMGLAGRVQRIGGGVMSDPRMPIQPGVDMTRDAMRIAPMAARVGIGPEAIGELLFAQRRGRPAGDDAQGNARRMMIAEILEQAVLRGVASGLNTMEAGKFAEQIAIETGSVLRTTGINVNTEAAARNLFDLRTRSDADAIQVQRITEGMRAAGRQSVLQGPQSLMDIFMLQAGGLTLPASGGVTAEQIEEAQINVERGQFSQREVLDKLVQAGGGGAAGRMLTRHQLGKKGIGMGAELGRQFLGPLERGAPDEMDKAMMRLRQARDRGEAFLEVGGLFGDAGTDPTRTVAGGVAGRAVLAGGDRPGQERVLVQQAQNQNKELLDVGRRFLGNAQKVDTALTKLRDSFTRHTGLFDRFADLVEAAADKIDRTLGGGGDLEVQ